MALPKSTGLYELGLVLAMTREKGETAQQWLQRLDQGRTVVGRKLGGNNLSDSCYVELLMRGLGNKERSELIKAQVLRKAKSPYDVGMRVLVTSEGKAYRARITCVWDMGGKKYLDVEYDTVEGFSSNIEEKVDEGRLTLDVNFKPIAVQGKGTNSGYKVEVEVPRASSVRRPRWLMPTPMELYSKTTAARSLANAYSRMPQNISPRNT